MAVRSARSAMPFTSCFCAKGQTRAATGTGAARLSNAVPALDRFASYSARHPITSRRCSRSHPVYRNGCRCRSGRRSCGRKLRWQRPNYYRSVGSSSWEREDRSSNCSERRTDLHPARNGIGRILLCIGGRNAQNCQTKKTKDQRCAHETLPMVARGTFAIWNEKQLNQEQFRNTTFGGEVTRWRTLVISG